MEEPFTRLLRLATYSLQNCFSSSRFLEWDDLTTIEIDHMIVNDKAKMKRTFKILLLGGPASGKSTIFKQMKILHKNGFTETDWTHFHYVIHRNLYDGLKQVIEQAMRENFILEKNYEVELRIFNEFHSKNFEYMMKVDEKIRMAIKVLCKSEAVQKVLNDKLELSLMDSAPYFIANCDRILADDYKPTEQDALRTRVSTTGIIDLEFDYKNRIIRMIDVGGQQSERRKWIKCFDECAGLLFVMDLSAYNLKMDEDEIEFKEESDNVLKHSMELYLTVSKHSVFEKNTSLIVFLNKEDLFKEKMEAGIPISNHFRRYKEFAVAKYSNSQANNYVKAIDFIKHYVLQKSPKKHRDENRVFVHATTATDTQCVKVVFEDCTESVLRANLATAGYA